jgi:hypothetical protein
MRKNEHPRCGCGMCKRGAASGWGKHTHRAVNRKIRHNTKRALRSITDWDGFVSVIVSTPYTD